jgi:hypothetical protein
MLLIADDKREADFTLCIEHVALLFQGFVHLLDT